MIRPGRALVRDTAAAQAPEDRPAIVYVVAEGEVGLRLRLAAAAQARGVSLDALPIDVIAGAPNFLDRADGTWWSWQPPATPAGEPPAETAKSARVAGS